MDILFLTKLSPSGFVIHWCFLLETVISVVVAELVIRFLKFDIVVQEQLFLGSVSC